MPLVLDYFPLSSFISAYNHEKGNNIITQDIRKPN